MNGAPYETPVLEVPRGVFSLPWKMWLGSIVNILTGVQFYAISSYQTVTNGFTVTPSSSISKLILTPAGALAAGTINMPAAPYEGMEFRISSTYAITALTLTPATGQTVKNAATTLAAGVGVCYTYASASSTWYRLY